MGAKLTEQELLGKGGMERVVSLLANMKPFVSSPIFSGAAFVYIPEPALCDFAQMFNCLA
jgi:hypothetical protein